MSNVIDFRNTLDRMNREYPTEPGSPGSGFRGLSGMRGLGSLAGMGNIGAMGDNGVITFDDGSTLDTTTGTATDTSGNVFTPGSSGSGFNWSGVASSTIDTLKSLWIANRQADLQSQLLQLNMQRAAQGLAPIPMSAIGSLSPQVNVGVAPETQQVLIYGGIALLVVMLLNGRKR